MKKRIISLLLSFVMVMSLALPVQAAETWNGDCFTYDGTTITGLSEEGEALLETNTEVVLPTTNPEGEAITAIGASAFDAGTNPSAYTVANKITAVTIPGTVTEIGNFAFRNTSLKEVVLPDSVTTLGSAVFLDSDDGTIERVTLSKNLTTIPASTFHVNNGNGLLRDVVIPEGVTTIGSRAFNGNNITSLSLPSTVTVIDSNAFMAHQLTELVIPDSVTKIGGTAFSQYLTGLPSTLTKVTIGAAVAEIGSNAFRSCALTEVDIPASLKNLNKSAFVDGTKGTVTVYAANADQASATGDYAKVVTTGTGHKVVFANEWDTDCFTYDGTTITGLTGKGARVLNNNTEVVLPETNPEGTAITAIGVSAFDGGTNPASYAVANKITAVTIPGTVTEIGNMAFRNTSLKEVVLPDSVTTLGSAVFTDSDNGTIEKITLSKNLTTIPASTFFVNNGNGPLKELIIPEGVTKVDSRAFSGNNITSLSLPSTLTEIGSNAFTLHQLTELVIPDSVTKIGSTAFSQYQTGAPSTLEKVTIGAAVTEIGGNAFRACALTEVDLPASVTNVNKNAFQNGTAGTVILYAANADQANATGDYAKVVIEGTGHKVVFANEWDADCFTYDGTTITGLTGKGVRVLKKDTEMVLPETNPAGEAITAIGVSAFDAGTNPSAYTVANKITAVTIPGTVTEIGNFAFRNTSLKEVVLPDSVTTLGSAVFLDSDDGTIEKITLSKNLTTIPASAFFVNSGVSPTKELVIPEGVTKVDSRAFSGNNITSLSLPSTLTEIGSNAFTLHQLKELVIPDSVTKVGSTAFSQYQTGAPSTLEKVTIGAAVKEIGSNAFRACALTEVDLPASVVNLNKSAFADGTKGIVTVYAANADQANAAGDYAKVVTAGTGHKVVFAMTDTEVEIADNQFVYDGNAVEPAVSVKDSDGNEVSAEIYDVTYDADSANVGKHNVTVTFKGAYAGEATAEYVVVPAKVEGLKGFRFQVGNRVKLEWKESAGATGYKVQYKSAKSSKTYVKYVTELEDVKSALTCSKTYTFKVTPYYEDENGVKHMASSEMDSVKVTTAKAISKTVGQVTTATVKKSSSSKVKVSWNNVKNEKGYQISRSTKADGTNIVKTVKSTSAKSAKISGGTKGTTYYYKVRAYRTVGTKKVYSDWTEAVAFTLE